jgi:hypothetical protein
LAIGVARRSVFVIEQLELLGFRLAPRHAHGAIVPLPRAAR